MSSTWDRPRPRTYEYNYQLQSSQYTPTLSNLDTKKMEAPPKTYTVDRSSTTRGRTLQYPRTEEDTGAALAAAKAKLAEMEERQFPQRQPLWQKHPYYVHEDTVRVPPRADSVWPEQRPHFHLVSSYDLMVGYLGLPGMAQRAMERQRNQ